MGRRANHRSIDEENGNGGGSKESEWKTDQLHAPSYLNYPPLHIFNVQALCPCSSCTTYISWFCPHHHQQKSISLITQSSPKILTTPKHAMSEALALNLAVVVVVVLQWDLVCDNRWLPYMAHTLFLFTMFLGQMLALFFSGM